MQLLCRGSLLPLDQARENRRGIPPWNRKVAMSSAFIGRLRTAITGPMEAKLAHASYPGLPQKLRFTTFAALPPAAAIGTSAAAQMPKSLAAALG